MDLPNREWLVLRQACPELVEGGETLGKDNYIAAGYIRTDLIDRLAAEGKLTIKDLEKRTSQRRLGSGADLAKAVRYVASDDVGFMTGDVIVINGGWTASGYY